MNGRVYDPNLGRFLSVDPVFQFPTNTQSLNPYSYVLNNPLSFTDPSGYSCSTDDTLNECSNKVDKGGSTTIKKDVTGSHIKQTVGAVGKDGTGHMNFVTGDGAAAAAAAFAKGNGANNAQGSNAAQTKPTDTASIGGPENTARQNTEMKSGSFKRNMELGDTGNESGKPLSADDRLKVVDEAVKALASKGLIDQHELVFNNKFATVKTKSDGSLDIDSLQTFRTLRQANKDAVIHSDSNESPLEGNTGLGSKLSTIYAGAVMAGAVSGRTGQPIPMNPLLHTEFVILHEFAHGEGIRDERAADVDALKKLGFW